MKNRFIFLFISIMIMGLTLIGCNNNEKLNGKDQTEDGKVNIRIVWWGNKEVHERTQKVIDLFEDENPNIKVSTEFTGWDGYWDKLATQAAGQNLPDVINMDLQYLSEYASRNLLADHKTFIDQGWLNFDDVDSSLLEGGTIDGKLYGINLGTNSPALTYDPVMIEDAGITNFEPGYTWEDFIQIARTIKEKLGDDVYIDAPNGYSDFGYYLRQHKLWLYNEDGTDLGYDDDQFLIDFFEMWSTLRKDEVTPPQDLINSIQGKEDELIVHKKSPFHPLTSNEHVAVQQAADRPLELNVFPSLAGGQHGLYLKPGQFFSVTEHSNHPKEAAMLIDFFTNSELAHEELRAIFGVPISDSIREHISSLVDDVTKQTFDYIELVKDYSSPISPPEPSGHGELSSVYDRIFEALSFEQITPEDAAKQFRKEAEAILSKNK